MKINHIRDIRFDYEPDIKRNDYPRNYGLDRVIDGYHLALVVKEFAPSCFELTMTHEKQIAHDECLTEQEAMDIFDAFIDRLHHGEKDEKTQRYYGPESEIIGYIVEFANKWNISLELKEKPSCEFSYDSLVKSNIGIGKSSLSLQVAMMSLMDEIRSMWQKETIYRVWDKTDKVMLTEKDITIDEAISAFDRFILLRYTGIEDKEGTPIFEGDLVHMQSEKSGNSRLDLLQIDIEGVVSYSPYDRVYRIIRMGDCPSVFNLIGSLELTVLGNIFENSDDSYNLYRLDSIIKSNDTKNRNIDVFGVDSWCVPVAKEKP